MSASDHENPVTAAVPSEDIGDKLAAARHTLLEISTRTRLLDTPRHRERSRTVEIEDERCDEVFRILALDNKTMVFGPREEEEVDAVHGELDEDTFEFEEDREADGLAARYTDNRLQTPYTDHALHKRLQAMYYDARMYEEERGVNILYLALGFLKWFDAESSDRERHAPLILLPVALERQSARKRFKLSFAGDELTTNLSLQAKIKIDFGLELPEVGDLDEMTPSSYFERVGEVVSGMDRWVILPNDMQLGFFSFTKFLMYRDLDPENWPPQSSIRDHALVGSLLGNGFAGTAPIAGDTEKIDALIDPAKTFHVLNADSSQALAIEEVSRGRNLVIQGPPGTGKSQTIANLIAAAVKNGKTVLFVAEKMAALNVVKRRLDNLKLGDMCLELHSHKAQKRAVLDELDRTLSLGKPLVSGTSENLRDLCNMRDTLNAHVERMHKLLEPAQITVFRLIGELVTLSAAGVKPPEFELSEATTWTRDDYRRKRDKLSDLVRCIGEIGDPGSHIWRGVGLESVLPTDVPRFAAQSGDIHGKLEATMREAQNLAITMGFDAPRTAADAARLSKLAISIVSAPEADLPRLATSAWSERGDEIRQLLRAGKTLAELETAVSELVGDGAWKSNVAGMREGLAAHGHSWFRIFSGEYRRASADLRGILNSQPPRTVKARIELLDRIIAVRDARKVMEDLAALGSEAFGAHFRGVRSDWGKLGDVAEWEQQQAKGAFAKVFRRALAAIQNRQELKKTADLLTNQLNEVWPLLKELAQSLKLDGDEAFGVGELSRIEIVALAERLAKWSSATESPSSWIRYRIRREAVAAEGLSEFADRLDRGDMAPAATIDTFNMAYYSALMRHCMAENPELAQFHGGSHDQTIERFRRLDDERIGLARTEVALAHYGGVPRHAAEAGDVGVLRREIAKKRRLLPIRQLMKRAGLAVQAIKPVFMMSPLSVAQYLEPGSLDFDLLLIDEASQVRPVEALGAVARVNQIVVVGDERQLPPTRFFNRFVGEDDETQDEDDFQTGDVESILGLCRAQNVPNRLLSWHYRSRHHSLIEVSNREYYGGRLYVIPSPSSVDEHLGLRFHYVKDGVYDRGGTSTNRKEAEAVAQAVIEHARENPELTLGVGTFSMKQCDAVRNEVERLRRDHPETEGFFREGGAEPFFVKNLETIQGDERDVVLISVGYGPDSSGAMTMNFGPLGAEGGERRLNVLITRARRRCEVFSSITEDDIDLSRARGLGPRGLKTFLQYARTGVIDVAVHSGKDFDSPFEEAVAKEIAQLGYRVEPQVGVAGFFIDLGVADPEQPGRFLLGVECDGASYHSARWARDRDRLRQMVLEDRGWVIHRIWSTDWYQDQEGQLRRLVAAIERAKIGIPAAEDPVSQPASGEYPKPRVVRSDPDEDQPPSPAAEFAVPYEEADFAIRFGCEIPDIPIDARVRIVADIVRTEQPIHEAEIVRRFTKLAGKGRAGARISAAVGQALTLAKQQRKLLSENGFFSTSRNLVVTVRDRTNVESRDLRKPEFLPPQEIAAAVRRWVELHLRVGREEIATGVCRVFGFGSTSRQLREVIDREVERLLNADKLAEEDGRISVPSEHESDARGHRPA